MVQRPARSPPLARPCPRPRICGHARKKGSALTCTYREKAWSRLLERLSAAPAPVPAGSESRHPAPGGVPARLEARLGPLGTGVVGFFCCGATLAAVGALAWVSGQPWAFPSLAPTVLLVFETPLRPQASPRHVVLGHSAGILIGYGALAAFGLVDAPAATIIGFSPARIGAVALAVALTTFVLHAIRCTHPPAGASALIVALGILQTPEQLLVMFGAVVLVTALAWAFNRLSGVTMPLWSPHTAPHPGKQEAS